MNALVDRLSALRREGALDALAASFAGWVRARDGREGADADAVTLAACLVSRAADGGDVAVDLDASAGLAPWPGEAPDLVAPALDAWLAALAGSAAVAREPEDARAHDRPLVLRGTRLALARFDAYERGVAAALVRRASTDVPAGADAAIAAVLARLFGDPTPDEARAQRDAAHAAASGLLTVISGGPGTGKTTTVVRILALLAEVAPTRPRVLLAAPTGKAAARIGESIREGRARLREEGRVAPEVLDAIPNEATTVHRLIGAVPGGRLPRYGRDRKRPADVVVVDEASMVDLALMARLLDAVPDEARLILLGDRDQLASVEAGAVLGDLCAAADEAASPLHAHVRSLTHSFRFREDGGIGRVAAAVRAGEADGAVAALRADDPEVGLHDDADVGAVLDRLLEDGYRDYLARVETEARDEADVEKALAAFDHFRILCAVKDGPRGVAAVNRRAEDRFREPLGVPRRGAWYRGRPVLVLRNERSLGLWNGDVGVTLAVRGENGEPSTRVAFRDESGGVRLLSPGRLPEHETCWAMTVHKSQGSEFDRVALVLPDLVGERPSPVTTRELVYTGLTRARTRVDVFATEAAIAAALAAATRRASGLRDALAGPYRKR